MTSFNAAAESFTEPRAQPTAEPVSESLLSSAAEQSAQTPASLHRENFTELVRIAALMVDDRYLAEEIVQEAFARLIGHWQRVDPGRAVGYLYRSVANGAKSALRRRRTVRAHPPGEAQAVPGADAAVLRAAGYQSLLDAVAALPFRQRQVLVLRYYAEKPVAECAGALGLSETAVTAATHRAIKTLARRRSEFR